MATHIHGSPIVAALKSNLAINKKVKDCTRVWCEDGSLHLVTGYKPNKLSELPSFHTIVGYWEIPDGLSYLSPLVKEVITRPTFVEFIKD